MLGGIPPTAMMTGPAPSGPPLMASLAPAPLVPPPAPPELLAAKAKITEASKLLLDAATMFPPLGRALMPLIALLTKVIDQSAQPFGPPQMRTADGSPGPMLTPPPAGLQNVGNPQLVLRALLGNRAA